MLSVLYKPIRSLNNSIGSSTIILATLDTSSGCYCCYLSRFWHRMHPLIDLQLEPFMQLFRCISVSMLLLLLIIMTIVTHRLPDESSLLMAVTFRGYL